MAVTKKQEMQRLIRRFRDDTGKSEVDMNEVAEWAARKGWPLPQPRSPLELLAREFAAAAREEQRRDEVTGRTYRAQIAYKQGQGDEQMSFWIDVDDAPRRHVVKALTQYREQMVGDAWSIACIQDHWNRIHPDDEPIQMEMDFGPDIEWRKFTPDGEKVT